MGVLSRRDAPLQGVLDSWPSRIHSRRTDVGANPPDWHELDCSDGLNRLAARRATLDRDRPHRGRLGLAMEADRRPTLQR